MGASASDGSVSGTSVLLGVRGTGQPIPDPVLDPFKGLVRLLCPAVPYHLTGACLPHTMYMCRHVCGKETSLWVENGLVFAPEY